MSGARVETPATPHIVIIGGGITGLSTAYALATDARARDLGAACTLIEQDARLGGKLQTDEIEGCLIENGPDSFLATKPWAADLCRALGLSDHLIGTTPGRAVYVASGGSLHPLPEGLVFGVPTRLGATARSALLAPLEKVRAAADLVLPRRRDADDESIGHLLRRRLGRAVVTRLAGPLLAGIYAGDPDALSARATFPLLVEWEAAHRSLILAAYARAAQTRRQARAQQRDQAPGGNGPSAMFLSLGGGLGELVDRLTTSLGATRIVAGRRVTGIARRAEHGPGRYLVTLDDGPMLAADAVLLSTPAYVTADLLAPLAPNAAAALRTIPYVSTAAVTLAYRRGAIRHPLDGHGFVVARDEPLSITACTWVSSKWPHRSPPEITLLRCYLGAAGREAVVSEDDRQLVDLARADLRTTMGIDATPIFTSVARWIRAMPQYAPGHLERLVTIDEGLRGLPGIAVAGAAYRGIGIPDCVRQGTEAASRVIETLSVPSAQLITR